MKTAVNKKIIKFIVVLLIGIAFFSLRFFCLNLESSKEWWFTKHIENDNKTNEVTSLTYMQQNYHDQDRKLMINETNFAHLFDDRNPMDDHFDKTWIILLLDSIFMLLIFLTVRRWFMKTDKPQAYDKSIVSYLHKKDGKKKIILSLSLSH